MPKSQKNVFESGGFAMGRLGYLKHEYYFAPPYTLKIRICSKLLAEVIGSRLTAFYDLLLTDITLIIK